MLIASQLDSLLMISDKVSVLNATLGESTGGAALFTGLALECLGQIQELEGWLQ